MVKAAILRGYGEPLTIEDVELTAPGPDEVLVKTAAVGLCHSDLHAMQGLYQFPLPAVMGHEVSGVVLSVGEHVHDLAEGDHVVGCLSVHCGHCRQCEAGHQVLCQSPQVKAPPGELRRLAQGDTQVNQIFNLSGFAERLLVHRRALVKIRQDMPLDRAALLGCAVLTGTGAVFRSARVAPGSTVAVIGCGGVGLSTINGAAIAGAARIIAIDTLPAKLEMARTFGATDVIDGSVMDPVAAVMELVGGVDYSFECIGLKATAEQSYAMLAPAGLATVIGLFAPDVKIELPGIQFLQEKKIQGSFLGSSLLNIDIGRLVELYLKGDLKLDELISKRIALQDINEGFKDMQQGTVARSVVVFP
ncbi:Zn-dependent alcohol dehydrogenase [Alloalcanivorax mobilis]|uniref:Zn-dependent alcohol dehydrogenase n=1 Tax=Alloalcanivorax mobilis TaxID=2019569 RepID=UPI000C786971|nr:Zn-dependent alcohol dehydrogenase [Alloalcanivorax mobilis]